MNNPQDDTCKKNKLEIIKELLKKQGVDDEKKQQILHCLNYLEFQKMYNEDDIFLNAEIQILFDHIL